MTRISLEYSSRKGTISMPLDTASDTVKLGRKKISSIILDPLSDCNNLRRIWLNDNHLTSLDLSPLSHCANLEILSISGNILESIDLTPLKHCKKLEELYLQKNNLESIELGPLKAAQDLRILYLDRNRIKRMQLDPLGECRALQEIRVWRNLMPSLDISVLFFLPEFRTLHIEEDKILTMDVLLKYVSEQMTTNLFIKDALEHRRIEWLDYTALSIRNGWAGVRSRLLDLISRVPMQYGTALIRGFFESTGINDVPAENIPLREVLLSITDDIESSDALTLIRQKLEKLDA
ncbi:MAG: leucine-rich repeat domain-containing protein [Candidatus Thorarchaeota archaeon]